MKMSTQEYSKYIKEKSPKSKTFIHIFMSFIFGGSICTLGQALINLYIYLGIDKELSGTICSMTLIFLSALLTGLGLYARIATVSGTGTLIPITGFANAIVAPSIEFRSEGYVSGVGTKMFIIAGPVLLYGVVSSVIYGLILFIIKCFK